MEAIDDILKLDVFYGWKQTERSMAHLFELNKGLDALEEIQKHPNKDIYEQASSILTNHFETEETQMDVGNGTLQSNQDGRYNNGAQFNL